MQKQFCAKDDIWTELITNVYELAVVESYTDERLSISKSDVRPEIVLVSSEGELRRTV